MCLTAHFLILLWYFLQATAGKEKSALAENWGKMSVRNHLLDIELRPFLPSYVLRGISACSFYVTTIKLFSRPSVWHCFLIYSFFIFMCVVQALFLNTTFDLTSPGTLSFWENSSIFEEFLLNKSSKSLSFEANFALSFEIFQFFRAWVLTILFKKKAWVRCMFPWEPLCVKS